MKTTKLQGKLCLCGTNWAALKALAERACLDIVLTENMDPTKTDLLVKVSLNCQKTLWDVETTPLTGVFQSCNVTDTSLSDMFCARNSTLRTE